MNENLISPVWLSGQIVFKWSNLLIISQQPGTKWTGPGVWTSDLGGPKHGHVHFKTLSHSVSIFLACGGTKRRSMLWGVAISWAPPWPHHCHWQHFYAHTTHQPCTAIILWGENQTSVFWPHLFVCSRN